MAAQPPTLSFPEPGAAGVAVFERAHLIYAVMNVNMKSQSVPAQRWCYAVDL
jgi:hypothetical protein